uniref:Uncharacterized protein n=1 Tax=Syphacia muris TaxID=451379 RepID=A0A0N5ARK4_9BILA
MLLPYPTVKKSKSCGHASSESILSIGNFFIVGVVEVSADFFKIWVFVRAFKRIMKLSCLFLALAVAFIGMNAADAYCCGNGGCGSYYSSYWPTYTYYPSCTTTYYPGYLGYGYGCGGCGFWKR